MLLGFLALAVCVVSAVGVAPAQLPAVQYAYDELGRLVAVVDQDGNAAIYSYDAVGNMLSIQRIDAATLPGRVAITALVPGKGKAGTMVSILGKGFSFNAGQNIVSFNGVVAAVTQDSANRLITTVPSGATTGPVTVAAPLGSAISPRPFRIAGAITLTPTTASLGVGGTQSFLAADGGVETTNVIWAVDGIVGGDPDVGTISAQGLYTAPATIISVRTVTVTATSKDDVTGVATGTVTLRPPVAAFLAAAPVGVQVTDVGLRAVVAPGVGVQRAPDATGLTVVATLIGVTPPRPDAFASVSPVSVSLEPLITSVSPATATRGSANLTLTVTGSGLAGAIGLQLLLNQVPDTTITVTNLTAAPDGAQVTAQISITATAVLGARVVRIHTAAGATTAVGTGGNVFTVQ